MTRTEPTLAAPQAQDAPLSREQITRIYDRHREFADRDHFTSRTNNAEYYAQLEYLREWRAKRTAELTASTQLQSASRRFQSLASDLQKALAESDEKDAAKAVVWVRDMNRKMDEMLAYLENSRK